MTLAFRGLENGLKNIFPKYSRVDTCAAEFASTTPYHYSTYERPLQRLEADGSLTTLAADNEVKRADSRRKVMILGGGPNRIGQGIEFDYCCCHASFAAQDQGMASVMVNNFK